MELSVRTDDMGTATLVSVAGEVDLATIPKLASALDRAIRRRPSGRVIVDLDGVLSLADLGLGVLLGAAGQLRQHGGDLVVVCTTASVLAQLAVTRFDQAVEVAGSIAAAALTR